MDRGLVNVSKSLFQNGFFRHNVSRQYLAKDPNRKVFEDKTFVNPKGLMECYLTWTKGLAPHVPGSNLIPAFLRPVLMGQRAKATSA